MLQVITKFVDLKDKKHTYEAGDIYPREGLKVNEKRIKELSSDKNKRGIPLIEKVEKEDGKKEVPKNSSKEEIEEKEVETPSTTEDEAPEK